MAGSFEDLMDVLGFDAAAYADKVGLVNRKSQLAKSNVGLAGEEQRRQISLGEEDRGFLRSGEHARKLALQRAAETNQLAGIDIASAEDLANLDFMAGKQYQQTLAQNQLDDASYSAALDDLDYSGQSTVDDLTYALNQLRAPTESNDEITAGLFPTEGR